MSGNVFDRLQKILDVQKQEEGISAGDIAQLPPALRKIMRLMLREIDVAYPAIRAAMDEMPDSERMSWGDLDQALEELTKQNWLIRRGEGEAVNYSVNLRRKAGSQLGTNFWTALEDKISDEKKKQDT